MDSDTGGSCGSNGGFVCDDAFDPGLCLVGGSNAPSTLPSKAISTQDVSARPTFNSDAIDISDAPSALPSEDASLRPTFAL
jgi:hypothetical protein